MKGNSRAWSTEARLQFIEFRLFWEGRINRADLIKHFGISVPQASIDLKHYVELAPDNVEYDMRRKAYFATDGFAPRLITPNSRDYLAQLEVLRAEQDSPFAHVPFISSPPSFEIVPFPDRVVSPEILKAVLSAIREERAMEIRYQSMSRPEPTFRWISPHSIGSDGFRWHIRAFCHEKDDFGDFIFGRILELGATRPSDAEKMEDLEWHTFVELTISPNPDLTEGQRKGIALDYGMTDNLSKLVVRKALAKYLKKRLGLIRYLAESDGSDAKKAEAAGQHICLVCEVDLPS